MAGKWQEDVRQSHMTRAQYQMVEALDSAQRNGFERMAYAIAFETCKGKGLLKAASDTAFALGRDEAFFVDVLDLLNRKVERVLEELTTF